MATEADRLEILSKSQSGESFNRDTVDKLLRFCVEVVRKIDVPPGAVVLIHSAGRIAPTGWVVCDGANGTPNLSAAAPGPDLVYVKRTGPELETVSTRT